MRLGLKTQALTDVHSAVMTASCLDSKDAIVLVSGSGTTGDVINTAHKAKQQGSTIIAITGNLVGIFMLNQTHVSSPEVYAHQVLILSIQHPAKAYYCNSEQL